VCADGIQNFFEGVVPLQNFLEGVVRVTGDFLWEGVVPLQNFFEGVVRVKGDFPLVFFQGHHHPAIWFLERVTKNLFELIISYKQAKKLCVIFSPIRQSQNCNPSAHIKTVLELDLEILKENFIDFTFRP
jgi:hypothetical protein